MNNSVNSNRYGQFNGNARLTDEETVKIMSLLRKKELTSKQISEMFSVGKSTISDIKLLKTWTHVSEKLVKENE